MIYYDVDASEWKLVTYSKPSVFATYNGTAIYPFGSNDWYIHNDTCKETNKYNKEINIMTLNLNACDPNREFNCIDGTWYLTLFLAGSVNYGLSNQNIILTQMVF